MTEPTPARRNARARRALRLMLVAGALLVGGGLVLTALVRSVLFPYSQVPQPPPDWPRPPGLVRVDVAQPEGPISEGWLLPGRGVSPAAPGPVVFFAHGNGELIDYAAPGLAPYRERGISVALLEYRGYGRSGGEPSQAALLDDVERFYDAVVARPEVDGARALGHGRSLGGGVMCGLALRRPLRGLVLESTFRSVKVIVRRFLVPGLLVADPFDNEAAMAGFDRPVLVLHGTADQIIPFAHGERLAEVAADAELVAFESGHNDLPHGARYWQAIDRLIERAGR